MNGEEEGGSEVEEKSYVRSVKSVKCLKVRDVTFLIQGIWEIFCRFRILIKSIENIACNFAYRLY